jgi:hypothetical protein
LAGRHDGIGMAAEIHALIVQSHYIPTMLYSLSQSRWASLLLLFSLCWIVATASMSGSIAKWGLRDDVPDYGIEQVLDNTAIKPFAYRRLLPELADFAERITPQRVQAYVVDKLGPYRSYVRTLSSAKERYAFRYIVIMYACLGSCIGSLLVLRRVLKDLGFGSQAALFVPVVFILAFPFVQTVGGYPYDYPELFFMSAALLLALRRHWVWLCLLTIPATLNKESFFFFLITLYPILRGNASNKATLRILGAAILVAGCINIALKWAYLDAGGGTASFQLFNNIKYFYLSSYREFEVTYGFVGPSGAFIGTLAVIAAIVLRAWPSCSAMMRAHIKFAAVLNLPLFILFCATGELRNLSILFVGFIVLLAYVVDQHQPSAGQLSGERDTDSVAPVSATKLAPVS